MSLKTARIEHLLDAFEANIISIHLSQYAERRLEARALLADCRKEIERRLAPVGSITRSDVDRLNEIGRILERAQAPREAATIADIAAKLEAFL